MLEAVIKQGTPEFFAQRVGKITASRVGDLLTPKWGRADNAKARGYIDQLTAERLTGLAQENWLSPHMEWGVEQENEARREFEFQTGHSLIEVGFIKHPSIENSGASPDAILHEEGAGAEFKCPDPKTHLALLEGGMIKHEWLAQVYWCMACVNVDLWYFASYDPRFEPGLQMCIRPIESDVETRQKMSSVVVEVNAEIEARVKRIRDLHSTGLEPDCQALITPQGGPVEGAAA